jgi:hypothetical protein
MPISKAAKYSLTGLTIFVIIILYVAFKTESTPVLGTPISSVPIVPISSASIVPISGVPISTTPISSVPIVPISSVPIVPISSTPIQNDSSLPVAPLTEVSSSSPPPIQYCTGGYYCDGKPVPQESSAVGSFVCGGNSGTNYKNGNVYECVRDSVGNVGWQPKNRECDVGMAGRCDDPVVVPVAQVAPITPIAPIQYCTGGYYCDGRPTSQEDSKVGAVVCGRNSETNYKGGNVYECIRDSAGNVGWQSKNKECDVGMTGRCADTIATPISTPDRASYNYCGGGYYCDGVPIPPNEAREGAIVCGGNSGTSYKGGNVYECKRDPNGVLINWRAQNRDCDLSMKGRCAS